MTQIGPRVGKIPWRRIQQPTPVFLPGESHRRSQWAFVHRVANRQTRLKQLSMHAHICTHICNGTLFSFKKEGDPDICYNLGKS